MRPDQVPLLAEIDRLWLTVEAVLAVGAVVVLYLAAKLRLGWWRPRRPRH